MDLLPVTYNFHICDMFGYSRPGRETRPSMRSCVLPPVDPTPSITNNSQGGYSNGRLHDVQYHIGACMLGIRVATDGRTNGRTYGRKDKGQCM